MTERNLYFDLLPNDLRIELALYSPLEAVKLYCKTLKSWRSICSNIIYLRKYIAYIYNIPMEEVLKVPDSFFIEYVNSPTEKEMFDVIIKYDFEPLFEYYLQETTYGEALKSKYKSYYLTDDLYWLDRIMEPLIKYKSYRIIKYLMKIYGRKLSTHEKGNILAVVENYEDDVLFDYFIKDLGWSSNFYHYYLA